MASRGGGGFLALLSDDDRAELCGLGSQRRYQPGKALFLEGDTSDFVVILTQGRVKVFCTTSDGREPCLAVRGPGEIVGELAAIDGDQQPRVATVIAVEAVVARVVPANVFLEFVTSRPAVAVALLRAIVARLRAGDRRRVEFAYDTLHRLAALLVDMTEDSAVEAGGGVRLTVALSQTDLADMIGASRESVARSLAKLRDANVIQTHRRGVVISDPARLRHYAR